jgi:hypothetical protein
MMTVEKIVDLSAKDAIFFEEEDAPLAAQLVKLNS